MDIVMKEELTPLISRLENLESTISLPKNNELQNFFNLDSLAKELNVSKRTIKNWRDKGWIGYCQVGRKIFFRKEDVELFLRKHLYEPFISNQLKNSIKTKDLNKKN